MKCALCQSPAEEIVVYKKEQNTEQGYLAVEKNVVFDKTKIEQFVYTCETKGLHLKPKGMLDLCRRCLRTLVN